MLTDERRSEITHENMDKLDCGVVALQAVTGWKRRTAIRRLGKAYTETGTSRGGIELALIASGFTVEEVPRDPSETAATFAVRRDTGSFLIYVSRHVMALIDGELFNSRGYFRAPVESITKVSKKA